MRGRIVNYIFYDVPADAVVKIGCERKNCYWIPAWFRFSLFFGPAEIVFSGSDLDPHFPCVKLNCPVANFNGNVI